MEQTYLFFYELSVKFEHHGANLSDCYELSVKFEHLGANLSGSSQITVRRLVPVLLLYQQY